MLIRNYQLRFVTPAFLGNADQSGQWRTPPIKAMLRQWWRVAYAASLTSPINSGAVEAMRTAEGRLFGVAADGQGDSRKSQVRIRLDRWSMGVLKTWEQLEQTPVTHREVQRTGYKVGPHAYLGFGPLDGRGGTRLSEKCNAAIQAGESALLSLAFPGGTEGARLDAALWLMHHYGALGGRSRNGWGSFSLSPAVEGAAVLAGPLDGRFTANWRDALRHDWPHAIGSDESGPLIWQTEPIGDWKAVMRRLAEIKIGLRTQFAFTTGRDAARVESRHWLSHPVTNHNVAAWRAPGKGEFRLPNSLRFKVRADGDGKLHGVIVHVPCRPPPQFKPDLEAIVSVWQQVHAFLAHPEQRLQRTTA